MTKWKRGEVQPLYLLDAPIIFFKYYFSMPDQWYSEDGYPTAAVYGYCHWLKKFLLMCEPQYMVACFDESLGTCFRNKIDANYKCSRPPADEFILYQMEMCKTITSLMGIPVYASSAFEADDLIGTLAQRHSFDGGLNCILSRDKDLMQLVGANDYFWNFPDAEPMDYQGCRQKMGVNPEYIADYLALLGDAVDDIPGVPGVGVKTAQALVNNIGSVEVLYQNLQSVAQLNLRGASLLAAKLALYKDRVLLNKRLTTINTRAKLMRRYSINKKPVENVTLQALTRSLGFKFNLEL